MEVSVELGQYAPWYRAWAAEPAADLIFRKDQRAHVQVGIQLAESNQAMFKALEDGGFRAQIEALGVRAPRRQDEIFIPGPVALEDPDKVWSRDRVDLRRLSDLSINEFGKCKVSSKEAASLLC